MIQSYTLIEGQWRRITDPGEAGTCWLKKTGGGVVAIARTESPQGDTFDVGSSAEAAAGISSASTLIIDELEDPLQLTANTSYDVFYALIIESTRADRSAVIAIDTGPAGLGGSGSQLETSLVAQQTAFGELAVTRFEPLASWQFFYNLNPAIVRTGTVSTGSVTQSANAALLSTGTASDGQAFIETIRANRYVPGVGGMARFTAIFAEPQPNSIQIIGIGNTTDGWFFGYDGLQFGVLRRDGGLDNWTYITDWNGREIQGFDPQKGNVYQIRYQWLGFGGQFFGIENNAGRIVDVHTIDYANQFTATSIDNPNLPLIAKVENLGNTSDITLRTPSAVAGIDGDAFSDAISVNAGVKFTGDVSPGSDVPVLAVRLGETYLGKANRLFAQLIRLTFATSGAKPVNFDFFLGGTVTGGTWLYVAEQQSPLEYNNTITSYTPGTPAGTFGLGVDDSYPVDVTASKFRLYPGQILVAIARTSSTASTIVVGENWKVFV